MSSQPDQVNSSQALATVMRFLRQHNYNATVDTLQKEICMSGGGGGGVEGGADNSPSLSGISRSPLSNPEECRQSYVSALPEDLPEMSRLCPSPTQADLRPAEALDDDRGTDSGFSATPSSLHNEPGDAPTTASAHHHRSSSTPTNASPPCLASPPSFPTASTAAPPTTAAFFYQSPGGGLGVVPSVGPSPAGLSSRPALVGALPASVLTLVAGQGLARFPHQPPVVLPPLLPLSLRPFTSVALAPPQSMALPTAAPPHFSPAATPTSPMLLSSLVGGATGLHPHHHHRLSSDTLGSEPPTTTTAVGAEEEEEAGEPGSPPQLSIAELRAFAEEFRRRRISLGYTQGAVGSSLANMGYANFAQSTISRFEQMQLSPRNAASIKEVLAAWLKQAECYPQGALANSESLPSPTPLPLTSASSIYQTRKRKKRAVFSSAAKGLLEEAFDRDCKPNRPSIERLARELDMLPEEVRVWFCNKRQKEKGDRRVSSQDEGEEVNSTSDSPISSTTGSGGCYEEGQPRADSSSEIPQNFRIEEISKSSSSSPVSFTT